MRSESLSAAGAPRRDHRQGPSNAPDCPLVQPGNDAIGVDGRRAKTEKTNSTSGPWGPYRDLLHASRAVKPKPKHPQHLQPLQHSHALQSRQAQPLGDHARGLLAALSGGYVANGSEQRQTPAESAAEAKLVFLIDRSSSMAP